MSTKNKYKNHKKKCKILKSASAGEAGQAKSNVSAKSTTMDVSKEYLEVLKLSFRIKSCRNGRSKKNKNFIKDTEMWMDKLFYEVIDSKNAKFDDTVVLAQAYLYVSHIISDEKEVLYDSEIHLAKCLELLNGEDLNRKAILIVISALSELAELAYTQRNVRKSKSLLNYALQQCLTYTSEKEGYLEPIYVPSTLGIEHPENKYLLEKLHVHIVTYLQMMHYVDQDDSILKILDNFIESAWSTQMEFNRENEFLNVLKSSFRAVNIDPIIEPDDRKKKLIRAIEARMDKLFHDVINSHDVKLDDMVILARAYLYMSTIYSTKNQKGDLQKCESHLTKCTMLLKEKELDSKSILIAIRALNGLACIQFKLEEPEKSELFLNNARRLYLAYTKGSDEYPEVIDVAMIFGIEYDENCKTLFERSNEINLMCLKILHNEKPLIPEDLWNDLSKWISVVEETKSIESVNTDIKVVREEFIEIFKTSFEVQSTDIVHTLPKEKKVIKAIIQKANKLFHDIINLKDVNFNENVILAHTYFYISDISISMKEEKMDNRIRCMTKCMQLLNGRESDPKAILIAMNALQQLTNMYVSINHVEKAKSSLEKAMQLYMTYTKEIDFPTPINVETIFGLNCDLDSKDVLDDIFVNILNLFGVLNKKIANSQQTPMYSTIVCMHKTLKEKLNFLELIKEKYKILILKALTLSKYFIIYERFIEAKSHLAIAYYLRKKFCTHKCAKEEQETHENTFYFDQYINAAMKKYLAEYGLYFLFISRKKLLQNKLNVNEEDDKLCEANSSKLEFPTSGEQCVELLLFTDIEKEVEEFTGSITDNYLLNYDDAKKVFVNILKWLDETKSYCSAQKNVLYEEVILNTAYAYKYFVYYEQDEDKRIKLLKRYIEILQNFINFLTSESKANRAKRIWFELGIAYTTLLDIKTNSLQITGYDRLSEEQSMDIDKLARSGMQNFRLFISFTDSHPLEDEI